MTGGEHGFIRDEVLAMFVHMIEVKRTVIHREVVHCRRFVSTGISEPYASSSRSESSDNDDAASSFNSEYGGDGGAIASVLSSKRQERRDRWSMVTRWFC